VLIIIEFGKKKKAPENDVSPYVVKNYSNKRVKIHDDQKVIKKPKNNYFKPVFIHN